MYRQIQSLTQSDLLYTHILTVLSSSNHPAADIYTVDSLKELFESFITSSDPDKQRQKDIKKINQLQKLYGAIYDVISDEMAREEIIL
jgi:hypothetical protein